MKYHMSLGLLIFFILSTCFANSANEKNQENHSTVKMQLGTLTNEILRKDTMIGVLTSLKSCQIIDHVQPFIAKNPTGNIGSRQWEEAWVILGCNKMFRVDLLFKEQNNGAIYNIINVNSIAYEYKK